MVRISDVRISDIQAVQFVSIIRLYSERPRTGRPVWRTGQKSVRLSDVRALTRCSDFRRLLYLNKGDVIPSFSAAETILPDDVIEEIHHHVAGQDGQHHVSHRFATVAPPMKKFDLEFFFFKYSGMLKSEHVRISDRTSLFATRFGLNRK